MDGHEAQEKDLLVLKGGFAAKAAFTVFDLACCMAEAIAVGALGGLIALALSLAFPTAGMPAAYVSLAGAIGYFALAWVLQIYPRRRAAFSDPGLALVMRVLAALVFSVAAFGFEWDSHRFVKLLFALIWYAAAAAGIALIRQVAPKLGIRLIPGDFLQRPAVVVGSGVGAIQLMEAMRRRPFQEFKVLGYFDDRHGRPGAIQSELPFLGSLDDLIAFVEDYDQLNVFMALPWTAGSRIAQLLERLRFLPVIVQLTPDPDVSALSVGSLAMTDSVLMPTLMTPPFSQFGRLSKSAFDLVVGMIALILASPVLLVVGILIKLDSPGPVFFRQLRSGQYGRKFSIYKFRSLYVAKADSEAATLVSKGDSRVTRIGHYIRKYSLDELPQILNVLRGDMSLVGPRPHAPKAKADGKLYAEVVPDYAIRYRVKPGMTGWAQINGWRGETDTEEKLRKRVEFDFYYISHWRFWLDVVILVRTVPAMLFPPKSNV